MVIRYVFVPSGTRFRNPSVRGLAYHIFAVMAVRGIMQTLHVDDEIAVDGASGTVALLNRHLPG